jgi:hypothetical protein
MYQNKHNSIDTIYSHRLSQLDDAFVSSFCRPACAEFIASCASLRSFDRCSGGRVFDGEEVPRVGSATRHAAD